MQMLKSVAVSGSGGFATKRIHFCVREMPQEMQIWETSLNASCASTTGAAHKSVWPPRLTAEKTNFEWIAVTRFATAYCDSHATSDVCSNLEIAPPARKSAWLRTLGLVIPQALANEGFELKATEPSAAAPAAAAASEPNVSPASCKVENDMMVTKKGNLIFLDVGAQPATQHASLLHATAAMAASDGVTDLEVQDNLSQLTKMGEVIVNNYKSKKSWVTERLRKDRVQWIGTEQSAEELGARGLRFAESYDVLSRQLAARKVTKGLSENAMISGACPSASVCVWLRDRNARKDVQLIPIEEEADKQRTLDALKTVAGIFRDLDSLVDQGKITKAEAGFIKREWTNLDSTDAIPDVKEREKLRRRYGQPEVSQAVRGFFDASVALKKSLADRQKKIVQTALAQTTNGILAVGTARRATLIPLLESLCDNPMGSPPSFTDKPAGKKPGTVKR